jgi:uncharacterized protein (TIGR03067 family)
MRRLHLLLLAPIAGLLLAADDPIPKGLEKCQGTWVMDSLVVEGKDIPQANLKKTKLTIKGDKYTFVNVDVTNKGVYKVDPTKKPMTLDIVVAEGPDKGKTLSGIYEVDGDSLKICLSIKGNLRPEAFASKADSGIVLESWKKTKE